MEKAKDYLKKLGVAIPAGSFEWNQATKYRTIRNKIMHEGSRLGEDDDIVSFASKNGILDETSSLDGKKQYELRLTKDLCKKALNGFQKILIDVNSAYQQWKESNRPAVEEASPTLPWLTE